jgi:hypothetical protein
MSDNLTGLRVATLAPCGCGTRETTITDQARLRCACGADRGALGPKTRAFITGVVNAFGAPEAIQIRRSFRDFDQPSRRG